jgi:arginyl-tRNA synthetase
MAADPLQLLHDRFQVAITTVLGSQYGDVDPVIRPSTRPEWGDYQVNAAMSLAKRVGCPPRDLAAKLVEAVEISDLAHDLEIAGPGFINVTFRSEALGSMLQEMAQGDLGVVPDLDTHAVVIDLCGVNVAKQMHVGHLRSTIIGDSLARVFERLGRTVFRENHLGDWGLPVAMVLASLRDSGADLAALTMTDLDAAYRTAQLDAKLDDGGLEDARSRKCGPHRIAELEAQHNSASDARECAKKTLLGLQSGDQEIVQDWQQLIDCTMSAVYASLEHLGAAITSQHTRGESTYRGALPGVIDAFVAAGIAREDDGALVVDFDDRDRPLLIRKSDGGFLYATTDLAAIRFRVNELGADRLIYVVDARQRDHFRDVFDAARAIEWDQTTDGAAVTMTHLPFGSVLGKDRKPLKTRSGDNVTLASLLQEASDRGTVEVSRRAEDSKAPTHGLDPAELASIGRVVGIGAVKYADLSADLVRDYVFDMDRMITFEGNTGPYLQYAHARICTMLAKAEDEPSLMMAAPEGSAERNLSLQLLKYGSAVHSVASSLEPHRLCTWLYDLAEAFSTFYQHCPVLVADDVIVRKNRLALCDLTRRVLAEGLLLLGIEAPPRM